MPNKACGTQDWRRKPLTEGEISFKWEKPGGGKRRGQGISPWLDVIWPTSKILLTNIDIMAKFLAYEFYLYVLLFTLKWKILIRGNLNYHN